MNKESWLVHCYVIVQSEPPRTTVRSRACFNSYNSIHNRRIHPAEIIV